MPRLWMQVQMPRHGSGRFHRCVVVAQARSPDLRPEACSSSSTSAAPVALELGWPALELVFCRTSFCTGPSASQLPSPSPVKSNGSASGKANGSGLLESDLLGFGLGAAGLAGFFWFLDSRSSLVSSVAEPALYGSACLRLRGPPASVESQGPIWKSG
eukprot:scaffold5163_cov66-Phaeocystis_antarctica.AAC.5